MIRSAPETILALSAVTKGRFVTGYGVDMIPIEVPVNRNCTGTISSGFQAGTGTVSSSGDR